MPSVYIYGAILTYASLSMHYFYSGHSDISRTLNNGTLTNNKGICTNKELKTHLWPIPKQFKNGDKIVTIHKHFKFHLKDHKASSSKKSHTLHHAFRRYKNLIFPSDVHNAIHEGSLQSLKVEVDDLSEAHIQIDTDESYTLNVTLGGQARLHAKTIYGALRGLETFSQLVQFNFDREAYEILGCPWNIYDKPRFPHRGLMIDTSRHFLPIRTILSAIDSMQYAKLNVLHWHIVDSQSFPMQSESHPELWKGAYSKQERYLQSEMKKVVEYARMRGIRVMIEFDVPGHAHSWCVGIPEICPSPTCKTPLNVANPKTFQIFSDLLEEVTGGKKRRGIFPDDFIHLGGDEVNLDCWSKVTSVKNWLDARNMTSDDGYKYFVDKVATIARGKGRRPVQWVEVFEHFKDKLDKQTIVHVWKEKETLRKVVKAGYNTILSNYRMWYLDLLKTSWETMYNNEPHEKIESKKEQDLILGGQVQMWGETCDESDFMATVWPRTAAFAERMWSDRSINSTDCALPRLKRFRCLLLSRGVGAAPVTNKIARNAPEGPGTCAV